MSSINKWKVKFNKLSGRLVFYVQLIGAQKNEIRDLRAALKKARGEVSGKAILNLAGKGMRDPSSLTLAQVRRVCASAVTQAANRNA